MKERLKKNEYVKKYLEDSNYRALIGIYISLTINFAYAIFKGSNGIMYHSVWAIAIGVYYLLLGGIRFMLTHGARKRQGFDNDCEMMIHECKIYRLCGIMMLIFDLIIAAMMMQMVWQNQAGKYSQLVVIVSACFTFYFFAMSIINAVRFRKRHSPILEAAKNLSLTGALMAMYNLQNSMLQAFGDTFHLARLQFNLLSGTFILMALLSIALYMVIDGSLRVKKHEGELEEYMEEI